MFQIVFTMRTYNGRKEMLMCYQAVILVFSLGRNYVEGEGTYNPKSAWMIVDSRRRVLPDIDGNFDHTLKLKPNSVNDTVREHFKSVENHILSDIHSYHMKNKENLQRKLQEETKKEKDQFLKSRFIPSRESWSLTKYKKEEEPRIDEEFR